jgi:hypothetical protein
VPKEIVIADSGFVTLVAVLSDDRRIESTIDYHSVWNRLLDAAQADDVNGIEEQNQAILKVFADEGFTGVSEKWCEDAYFAIKQMVDADKKKGSTSPTAVGAAPLASGYPEQNVSRQG